MPFCPVLCPGAARHLNRLIVEYDVPVFGEVGTPVYVHFEVILSGDGSVLFQVHS